MILFPKFALEMMHLTKKFILMSLSVDILSANLSQL